MIQLIITTATTTTTTTNNNITTTTTTNDNDSPRHRDLRLADVHGGGRRGAERLRLRRAVARPARYLLQLLLRLLCYHYYDYNYCIYDKTHYCHLLLLYIIYHLISIV